MTRTEQSQDAAATRTMTAKELLPQLSVAFEAARDAFGIAGLEVREVHGQTIFRRMLPDNSCGPLTFFIGPRGADPMDQSVWMEFQLEEPVVLSHS